MSDKPDSLLRSMFQAAVDAALPDRVLASFLPEPPAGRVIVLGGGKASAAMAAAVEKAWPDKEISGLIVTRYGHYVPCAQIEIVEAAHPVPDQAGLDATARMLQLARAAGPDDLVLFLMSGGASSLMTLPVDGVTLGDKQALNRALLRSGAAIGEMNCVRKHLSQIKGGRLALAAAPARMLTLLISDVPGDDPAVIGSGPTVPDPTTLDEARAILAKYRIDAPESVMRALNDPANETPKQTDFAALRSEVRMIAAPIQSLHAAAAVAREAGVEPIILGDAIEGESREVAASMATLAIEIAHKRHNQHAAPCVLISGGETSVTVTGHGRGGRNAEFLLALTIALRGASGVHAIACDTDGIDGSEHNAGALMRDDTLARAEKGGLDATLYLADNDGFTFFESLNDLIITGPTLTNVNDFRAIIIR